jgi:hypothetical protein
MSKYEQANHDDSQFPMAKDAHSARTVLSDEAVNILSGTVSHLPFDPRWIPHAGPATNCFPGADLAANTIQSRQKQLADSEKSRSGATVPDRDPLSKPMIDRFPPALPAHLPDGTREPSTNKSQFYPRQPVICYDNSSTDKQEPRHPWGGPIFSGDQGQRNGGHQPIDRFPSLPTISIPDLTGNGGHRQIPADIFKPTGNGTDQPKPNVLKPRPGFDPPSNQHRAWPPVIYIDQQNGDKLPSGLPSSHERSTTHGDRDLGGAKPNRTKDADHGCFGDFDGDRLKNLEDWLGEHVITLKPNAENKLKTGDTIKTTDNAQVMTMPNGDVLTVKKDGTYELKSATGKVTENKFDDGSSICVLKYPNGDSITFGIDRVTKNGRIYSVQRGAKFVGIERAHDDDDAEKR